MTSGPNALVPGGNPLSSLKKVFLQLAWAFLGLRFAFMEPSRLNEEKRAGIAPSTSSLLLGSVASFLVLVNVLDLGGAYTNFSEVGEVTIEEPIVIEQPATEDSSFVPSRSEYKKVSQHVESDDEFELTGVPGKLWTQIKQFLVTAYVLLALPGVIILFSVVGLKFMISERHSKTAGLPLEEAIEYVWYQALNLMIISALLIAAACLGYQFTNAILGILGIGFNKMAEWMPWLEYLRPTLSAVEIVATLMQNESVVFSVALLSGMFAAFSGILSLSWYSLGSGRRWLAPLTMGAAFALYAAPLFAFRYVFWLRWLWFLAVWFISSILFLTWLPVLAYTAVILFLKFAFQKVGLDRFQSA
ncbi:MAG: hypothetical protein AAF718_17355 [Pseudomonadota bacterium]